MIVKAKKVALVDEVVVLLEEVSQGNIRRGIEENHEENYRRFVKMNYHVAELERVKEYIELVNQFNLLTEERFKIVNYKPRNMLELSLIISNVEEKLSKEQIRRLIEFDLGDVEMMPIDEDSSNNNNKEEEEEKDKEVPAA